jgi:hypothetical protein
VREFYKNECRESGSSRLVGFCQSILPADSCVLDVYPAIGSLFDAQVICGLSGPPGNTGIDVPHSAIVTMLLVIQEKIKNKKQLPYESCFRYL